MSGRISSSRATLPLLANVALCTLPHFPYLELWVIIVCLCLWVYTAAAAVYSWRLPARPVMVILTGFFFVASMTTHEGLTIEAFIALLALMVAMKLLEIRTSRDRSITVILCYFLIVGGMFFSDTVWATMYKLVAILCTTALLTSVNFPGRGVVKPLKLSFAIMLQALPLTLILFLFFPRVQGGLWGQTHLNLARTGFTDELSFGSIAELAQNTAVAFRVEFKDAIPAQELLYWRGVVLWNFDGRKWERQMDNRSNAPPFTETSRPINYTVTLEPHNDHWLPLLDLPTEINLERARFLYDYIGYRWRPITSRVTYTAVSHLTAADTPLHTYHEKRALQLPAEGNPRARALARSLARESANASEYIQRVLRYFQEQPFSYTLTPPLLVTGAEGAAGQQDPGLVDRFLFESRRGFCEHFAGSFAFLMRAAGFPARVVLGYQGGVPNEYGGYLVVRQSNAHAWCEVWLKDKGWVRVDPTAVVAPERLTVDTESVLFGGATSTFFSLRNLGVVGTWLIDLRNRVDSYNNLWNRWVMTYSTSEQESFFGNLGIQIAHQQGPTQALLVFLLVTAILLVLINLFLFRPPGKTVNEATEAWEQFCRKLSRVGLPRRADQGPADYMEYVAAYRPDLARQVREIASTYIQLRFTDQPSVEAIISLKRKVKQFAPALPQAEKESGRKNR